jgi:beta-glucanase (GH16 family)
VRGNFVLSWADEFKGSSLNRKNWTWDPHCKLGYQVPPRPRPELLSFDGNAIHLKTIPKVHSCGDTKQAEASALISFRPRDDHRHGGTPLRSFSTGYLEARVKVSDTRDFHPAVWLVGWKPHVDAWPENGEIDIMEMTKNGTPSEDDDWVNAFHWKGDDCTGIDCKIDWNQQYSRQFPDLPTTWHVMGLWRSPTEMRIYYDGRLVRRVTLGQQADNGTSLIPPKLFTDPMFVLLSAQVCPLGQAWCETLEAPHEPSDLTIDYVRVWRFGP